MTQADLKKLKLEQIASEYRRRGYAVAVGPRENHIPAFLRPFQPDLVATSASGRTTASNRSSWKRRRSTATAVMKLQQ
jgi:hypothetical protein